MYDTEQSREDKQSAGYMRFDCVPGITQTDLASKGAMIHRMKRALFSHCCQIAENLHAVYSVCKQMKTLFESINPTENGGLVFQLGGIVCGE